MENFREIFEGKGDLSGIVLDDMIWGIYMILEML